MDKKTISYGQADNIIIAIAEKYDAFANEEVLELINFEINANIFPEIVIIETFI